MKVLVLENVRSAHNVGSMFRTADAAGVDLVLLVGYTPRPIDRFGRIQKEIEKTSLGASQSVRWMHCETTEEAVEHARSLGCMIVAVELHHAAQPFYSFTVPENIAYVLGNEVDGVSDTILRMADTILEIPMLGAKESLNVSVAAGIILYHGIET